MRKAVNPEDIPEMLRTWMRLQDRDAEEDEIVEGLSKYWTGRPLHSVEQAETYIERLVEARKVPDEYLEWLEAKEDPVAPERVLEAVSRCSKCGRVKVADPCSGCLEDTKRAENAADQKRDWDDRRITAHRRHGTHLKRCRCGHHLIDGQCPLKNCNCETNPGCAGLIETVV
jgi:hypothetical protein